MTTHPFPPGKGGAALESAVRQLAADKGWNVREPLPTTRELGARYGISNASVCRLLQHLSKDSVLWRRDNGRYYRNESRRLYERTKPYACMLRKLETWTVIYQNIMSGFGRAFGQSKGAILLIHNDTLFRRTDQAQPPAIAGADEQRALLKEFFRDHEKQFRGILLDQIWSDAVLGEFTSQLTHAVVVCRPTRVPGLSSVSVDFEAGALMAVGHLYARGFEEIWLAVPYGNSVNFQTLAKASVQAAAKLGRPISKEHIHSVATSADQERLVARLKAAKRRIGVFYLGALSSPADTIAHLRRSLAEAGLACPRQVGLLAGMSVRGADDQVSTFHVDYAEIGRMAGEILAAGIPRTVTIPAQLHLGSTT